MLIEEVLIVRHAGNPFGLSMAFVDQILRVPPISSLVLSPVEVCGLCTIGGRQVCTTLVVVTSHMHF